MYKKIIIIILILLLTIGCNNNFNTPTSRVESFLNRYQTNSKSVLKNLDSVVKKNKKLNKKQKDLYKSLLERQYQNLAYKIKKEEIEGKVAIVTTEIEVLDYASSIRRSKKYYLEHLDEFRNKNYNDYKLKELKNVTEKTKYDIDFYLIKDKGIWKLSEINSEDREKIHGLY